MPRKDKQTVADLKKALKKKGVNLKAKDIRKLFPSKDDARKKQVAAIKRKTRERNR